jgi:hypothetical protein
MEYHVAMAVGERVHIFGLVSIWFVFGLFVFWLFISPSFSSVLLSTVMS